MSFTARSDGEEPSKLRSQPAAPEANASRKSPTRSALAVAFGFAALAGGWVLLVHMGLNALMVTPQNYVRFDAPADVVLAALTTVLLFLIVRHELRAREKVMEALRSSHQELEERVRQRTAALAAERDKLFKFLDMMPDGICVINRQCEIEYVNSAMEKQWGPVGERPCWTYFRDQQGPCPNCRSAGAFAGQSATWEWFSENTRRTYEVFAMPLDRPEGETTLLEIFRDITERRAAEGEQVRLWGQIDAQRRHYRAVIDNAPVSIAMFTAADLRVKWANRQYHQSLPRPLRDLDISGLHLVQLFPDAAENGMLDLFARVAATGQGHYEPELMYWEPSRGQTYWQWGLFPLLSDDTESADLMLVASDITAQVLARKRTEELNTEVARQAEQARQDRADLAAQATELTALLDISRQLASTLVSRPLLDVILDQLRVMIDYTAAAVFSPFEQKITVVAYRGPLPQAEVIGAWDSLEHAPDLQEVLRCREPVIIADLYGDEPLARRFIAVSGPRMLTLLGQSRSWMGVPMMIQDRMIGLLRFDHLEPGHFTSHHAQLALTIANQAAIAMENARLYEEAGKVATLEERQRLARELHDSVSQALYGIALGTHAAREQIDRAPDKLERTLDYVLNLAETAVSAMRALIFELRPESLEQEGLVVALTRLAESSQARHSRPVRLDLCPEPPLPLAAKEAFFRIAQEALQNSSKHANAKRTHLRMARDRDMIVLEVEDDGDGFEPSASFPGHYGLLSMRERALRMGGGLDIDSSPGRGAKVRAWIPVDVR
jgi:signal transduction histidine kinase/PAS domain-containing protein